MIEPMHEPLYDPSDRSREVQSGLGFSFESLAISPIETSEDDALALDVLEAHLRTGVNLGIWMSYRDTFAAADQATRAGMTSRVVNDGFRELLDEIQREHRAYVDDEVELINTVLARYPEVVTRRVSGRDDAVRLLSVGVRHIDLDQAAVLRGMSPLLQFAGWSDGTQTELRRGFHAPRDVLYTKKERE